MRAGTAGTIGVTTLVAGRRSHLARQLEGLAAQSSQPDRVVVVCMDDEPLNVPVSVTVVRVPATAGELPLAAARNAGVQALGTDSIVLLDVDCIPGQELVASYSNALTGAAADGLVCGEVRYLPAAQPLPGPLDEDVLRDLSRAHPARPAPGSGELIRNDQHQLAWTTSLAFKRSTFERIGGFDERFVGYGGEDTDFGERARVAGVGVWWSGDAVAFHQHHGESGAPVRHVAAILRNAQLFAGIHGWWPMTGWLADFERQGLVRHDVSTGAWELA